MREVIYRDLKPDNVVMDEEGHVLLTDFGLSKSGIREEDITLSFCGSVAYLAPEMLQRTGHGRSVDWYLLGVLLYEMLIGIPPYFSSCKKKLYENILRGPLLVPEDISQTAVDFLVKLLNRDSTQRLGAGPGDAEEVKSDPFFKNIDWEAVRARRLKVPKPIKMPVIPSGITFDAFLKDEISPEEAHINSWTFIGKPLQLLFLLVKIQVITTL